MKALIVDDDVLIQDVLREFLAVLGHEADVAGNGHDAQRCFDPVVHRIVITDCMMPGPSGLDVASNIRAQSRSTPIVMISGYGGHHDEAWATRAGIHFLRKPVGFDRFAEKIEQLLHGAESKE